jgi:hypothetical protein
VKQKILNTITYSNLTQRIRENSVEQKVRGNSSNVILRGMMAELWLNTFELTFLRDIYVPTFPLSSTHSAAALTMTNGMY